MDIRYLPLLQIAKDVTEEGYDPKAKIQAFWEKYGVDHSRLNILNMFLFYRGETKLQDELSIEDMEQFSKDLMTLMMAYFVVHHEKINLDNLIMPITEVQEKSEEDKLYAEMLYSILGLRDFEHKL